MSPLLSQLTYYIAIFGGLIAAMFMGSSLGAEEYSTVIFSFLTIVAVMWVVLSGEGWWLPMIFSVGIGGLFYVPFKVYPHEIALAVCGIALLPRIPFKVAGLRKDRRPLPLAYWLLLTYISIHASIGLFNYWGTGGGGNVARAFMNGLWPLIFGLGFYLYGSIKLLKTGLRFLYLALVIRLTFGLVNYYFDDVFIIPGLNYTIDPQDLRNSGFMLVFLIPLQLITSRSPLVKAWHALTLPIAMYAWLLGGSRGQIAVAMILVFIGLLVCRRWVPLTAGTALSIIFVITINAAPSTLEGLPYRLQRAFSILIVGPTVELEVQQDVKGSDQFRSVISDEGYRRWSGSLQSFAVGVGVRPYDEAATLMAQRFEVDAFTLLIQSSADVGAYETGLWTVLAVTGVVGMALFAWLLISFSKDVVGALHAGHLFGSELAICIWAAMAMIGWFFTCPFYGGFPSFELFLGFIAKAVVEDRREEQEAALEAKATPPVARLQPLRGRQPALAGA
ncbi:MAG: hypothetical protein JSR82_15790 [Verrucomicrobia bacterium]|nr:hypothetical protein [Verrucomicrobiota bacterium]